MSEPGAVMRILRRGAPLLLALLLPAPLQAHSLDIAHFRVLPSDNAGVWRVQTVLPSTLDPALAVEPVAGCNLEEIGRSSAAQGYTLDWQISCDASVSEPAVQTRWGRDGAIVEVVAADDAAAATSMLPGTRLGARLVLPDPAQAPHQATATETALRYTWLGTTHVLIGWDHLAFVFCLAMLARGGALLWLISAFTVGHSISLAASFLGIVRIPIAPVEAVIALSVVFMAREAFLLHAGRDTHTQQTSHSEPGRAAEASEYAGDRASAPASRRASGNHGRLGLTAAFGLIHGLGFASVLGELGVSPGETFIALAFFNIGVELGQLLFVAVVLGLVFLLSRLHSPARVLRAALCVAGGMGLFWTLQRVAGL